MHPLTLLSREQDVVVWTEAVSHVISIQNGHLQDTVSDHSAFVSMLVRGVWHTCEALRSPSAPIILTYAHEIGRMRGEPHVAEDTVPRVFSGTAPTGGTTGCVGRNGARWALLHGGRSGRGLPPSPDIQQYRSLVAKLSQVHETGAWQATSRYSWSAALDPSALNLPTVTSS